MTRSKAGCQTCKIRRVKCDQAKPICQRCAKSRRVCQETNTAKQTGFFVHLENLYASGETKRPRGPRPRSPSSLRLIRPTFDVASRAVAYFLNYYLQALEDLPTVSACMSECFTAWTISTRESNMVDLAVSALSLAIFSRTQEYSSAAREAALRYARLLRAAQEQITLLQIQNADGNSFDKFLLVIVLMAWYETSTHQPANLKPKIMPISLHSWSHHDGAMAILRVWNDKPRGVSPSGIVKQSRRGLLRSALLRNRSLPSWIRNGRRFGEHGLDLGFDEILVRVVNLRYTLKNLGQHEDSQTVKIKNMHHEAQKLDDACGEWALELPHTWSYESHSFEVSLPSRDFWSSNIHVCAQHGYAAVWMQYFALRMLINSTLLSLLKLSHPPQLHVYNASSQQQRQECRIKLKTITDSLASTIPYALGRININNTEAPHTITFNTGEEIPPFLALPTIWPLSVASSLDGIDPIQRRWFQTHLARLGRVLGDGALQCAGTDQWTHE